MKTLTATQKYAIIYAVAFFLLMLISTLIVTLCAAFVVNRQLHRADDVIQQVCTDNPAYFYDVLSEGDAYQEYLSGKE